MCIDRTFRLVRSAELVVFSLCRDFSRVINNVSVGRVESRNTVAASKTKTKGTQSVLLLNTKRLERQVTNLVGH